MGWIRSARMAALAALLGACAHAASPAPQGEGRVFYEIVVSAPGTRSQGWRGALYDNAGASIALGAGESVDTDAGRFVGIACPWPWSACGAVREDMAAWMRSHQHNVNMNEAWTYRVRVENHAWSGALLRNGAPVSAAETPVATPMGRFHWVERDAPERWRGWRHEAWQ